MVELPPSSFLTTDPLLLALGAVFFSRLPQLRKEHLVDTRAIAALMIGFLIPISLMFTAMVMTFRFRMEFYPLIEFTAYLGFYAMCENPTRYSTSSRKWLYSLLIACAAVGIVCSHLLFILYKLSQFGDYKMRGIMGENPTGAVAWARYYWLALKTMLPSVAAKLPP